MHSNCSNNFRNLSDLNLDNLWDTAPNQMWPILDHPVSRVQLTPSTGNVGLYFFRRITVSNSSCSSSSRITFFQDGIYQEDLVTSKSVYQEDLDNLLWSLLFRVSNIVFFSSSYIFENHICCKITQESDYMLFRSASFCTGVGSIFWPFQSNTLKNATACPLLKCIFGSYIFTEGWWISSELGCWRRVSAFISQFIGASL